MTALGLGARAAVVAAAALMTTAVGAAEPNEPAATPEDEVRSAEIAFAKTMADRDHAAFVSFLADDAVFLGQSVLRGKLAVAAGWKPYYDATEAPFSWKPEKVVVVESGSLALSTGPVFGPEGRRVGTFVSTWRREADGRWRVVLDTGCPPCAAP